MTVICLTDPPPPNLTLPLSVTGPPYLVSGTTDRPFLAKVTFTFVGSNNPPMDMEHWVELEPLHSAIHPVLGDEQVLDIELDRHTELMPIRRGPASTKHKSERSTADHAAPTPPKGDEPCMNYFIVRSSWCWQLIFRFALTQTTKPNSGRFYSSTP